MLSIFQISLRRLVSTLLIATVLFIGVGTLIDSPVASAYSITKDVSTTDPEGSLNENDYESAKANRQRKQAMRSIEAEAEAEKIAENETIGEKLNLDEIRSDSSQKFDEGITDN